MSPHFRATVLQQPPFLVKLGLALGGNNFSLFFLLSLLLCKLLVIFL